MDGFFQNREDAIGLVDEKVEVDPGRNHNNQDIISAVPEGIEQVFAIGRTGHAQIEQDQIDLF